MLNFFASNTTQQMPENCGGQLVRQSCCWLIANYQVIGVLICTAYQMSQAIFCNSQKCRQYQFFHSAPSMLWYGLELRVSIFFRFKTVTFATFFFVIKTCYRSTMVQVAYCDHITSRKMETSNKRYIYRTKVSFIMNDNTIQIVKYASPPAPLSQKTRVTSTVFLKKWTTGHV